MTVRVTPAMRERIEQHKIYKNDGKKYIYESPDNGKTIYRREISERYDDVSGSRLDHENRDVYDRHNEEIQLLRDKINSLEFKLNKIRDILE